MTLNVLSLSIVIWSGLIHKAALIAYSIIHMLDIQIVRYVLLLYVILSPILLCQPYLRVVLNRIWRLLTMNHAIVNWTSLHLLSYLSVQSYRLLLNSVLTYLAHPRKSHLLLLVTFIVCCLELAICLSHLLLIA
jgi:hypothetical protein